MNKKIFTLLVGALLSIGSSFTASAQTPTPTVHYNDSGVNFADTLRADTAKNLIPEAYYLLSITDIANPTNDVRQKFQELELGAPGKPASKDLSYVMFVDELGQLRIDTLTVLDKKAVDGGYEFNYKGLSSKIGAIRQASWCVKLAQDVVPGSNMIYDFDNMATGEMLEAPLQTMSPNLWTPDPDGQGRLIYDNTAGINLVADDDLIVSGWHFSQTYVSTQKLQTGMPLYSYVEKDSVLVMVIADTAYVAPIGTTAINNTPGTRTGGWKATVKYVAVNDLIKDAAGNIRLQSDGGKYVSNVLLFTLKKLDKFVLNADDYNAVNTTIKFDLDASEGNDNPFTKGGRLRAFEVNDSLYRYGYMQFQQATSGGAVSSTGKWLFVDTGFWNKGNEEFLRFAWSDVRRDSTSLYSDGKGFWGFSFTNAIATDLYVGPGAPDTATYNIDPSAGIYDTLKYQRDSANYVLRYNADSIMENQSKFRVVYDPFTDSTYINVYQTRVAYTNYANPQNPVTPAWWTNSFLLDSATLLRPSDIWTDNKTYYQIWNAADNLSGPVRPTPRPAGSGNTPDAHFHSFVEWYPESSPKEMDKVMISTADTSVFNFHGQPLSHIYGWGSAANSQGYLYKDSLFYVDIQNLELNQSRIATLNQAKVGNENRLNTHIKLGFTKDCTVERDDIVSIGDDLYLIRNKKGEYLSVPLTSLSDSVYWAPVKQGEDPTQMPAYQWVVENKRKGEGSPFKLTNREFEHVSFDYVYITSDGRFRIGDTGSASAAFAREKYAQVGTGVVETALAKGKFSDANGLDKETFSFLPLASDVKGEQLLGYTYVDKDATYVDVYAFKYLHFLAPDADAKYMGWKGYDTPKVDSAIYLEYNDYHDKLYFMLQEMPYDNIGPDALKIKKNNSDYASIYNRYGKGQQNNYVNSDSIVMEHFGYMPTKRGATGLSGYDYELIPGLKPLARQAYRLLLKDYYKFSPTIRGDYLTVGEQDRYILSDRAYATRPYMPGSGRVEGVFGIPYFYFRNTYFNIEGVDKDGNKAFEDYFALVQRLDTISIVDGHKLKYDDVHAYLELRFGTEAADIITTRIERSKELGAFIAKVGDYVPNMRIAVRSESEHNVATFALEQDNDPLYRRFHWNDYFTRTNDDTPLVLEFHRLNNENIRLFENSGADKGKNGGGYEYNLDKNGNLLKDSLGHVISFLGVKNISTFPSVTENDDPHASTNYAIYVDTAFINRGTGWIKPQYMLAVDVEVVEPCEICEDNTKQDFRGYTVGRYLYNTSMYAKELLNSNEKVNYDLVQKINPEKIRSAINGVTGNAYTRSFTDTKWERLAFAWAIHRGDSLYVLKNVAPYYQGAAYDTQLLIEQLALQYPADGKKTIIDFDKLIKTRGNNVGVGSDKIVLHAIINLADNTHKDWVFSFRYIQRRADDFIIESETTERDRVNGPQIRPGYGGWVKYDNEVPIITRSDMHNNELLAEGDIMNVTLSNIDPVSNDPVTEASAVKVLGGNGAITIQNASGKTVVVSNVLGQTIANTKLSSDNASIAVPAGIVVVTVEGESATKVLVK